jgi:hypothetical protein
MDTGTEVMLFQPEHALSIAAEAVGKRAQSTDMAVGIILGIQAAIAEWNKLVSTPVDVPADPPTDGKARTALPRPRTAAPA